MPSPDQNAQNLQNYGYSSMVQAQQTAAQQRDGYYRDMAALQNRGMYNQNFNMPGSIRITQALDFVRRLFNVDYSFNCISNSHSFRCMNHHCVIHLPAEAEAYMTAPQIADHLANAFTNYQIIKETEKVSLPLTKSKFDLLAGG